MIQLVYPTIARYPGRYRPLMPVCVLAKLAFIVPVLIRWGRTRTGGATLAFASVDALLGAAFALARQRTPAPAFPPG